MHLKVRLRSFTQHSVYYLINAAGVPSGTGEPRLPLFPGAIFGENSRIGYCSLTFVPILISIKMQNHLENYLTHLQLLMSLQIFSLLTVTMKLKSA